MSENLDYRSRAAVERVRAAIAAAGEERLRLLAAHSRRVLEARSQGETLAAVAAREGITRQGVDQREKRALTRLAREPIFMLGEEYF